MKEKIQKKLEENLEKILSKEELTKDDVKILENKLSQLENKEWTEKSNERIEQLLEAMKVK